MVQIQISTETYLKLFRNVSDRDHSRTIWQDFVRETADAHILDMLSMLNPVELGHVGYYALVLGRLGLIKRWWNNLNLPQCPVTYESTTPLFDTLEAFEFHRLRPKSEGNVSPLKALLAVIKSRVLRKMYPQMLDTDRDSPLGNVRNRLVRISSGIPNGTSVLNQEWKKYKYSIVNVWGFPIANWTEFYDLEANVHSLPHRFGSYYTPFIQTCRYGTKKDLQFFMRHPELRTSTKGGWPVSRKWGIMFPLKLLILNANLQTLRYFMYLYTTCQEVLQTQFPREIANYIWSYTDYYQWCDPENIRNAAAFGYDAQFRWTKRLELLKNTFPQHAQIGGILNQRDVGRAPATLRESVYNCFVRNSVPVHPTPEELIWASSQKVLYSPKADGVTFIGNIYDCFPRYFAEFVKAEEIKLPDGRTLYLVFDVDKPGNWLERVEIAKDYHHQHFSGPYHECLGAENRALQRFLDNTRQHTTIWWPKSVYWGESQTQLLCLFDKPPVTPYPNDGWILASSEGCSYKIKPQDQLTVDLMYSNYACRGWGWGCCGMPNPEMYISPDFEEPASNSIWRCVWNKIHNAWEPIALRTDKNNPNDTVVYKLLTQQHKYPWRPLQLLKWANKKDYYYSKRHDSLPQETKVILRKQREIECDFQLATGSDYGPWWPSILNIGCGYRQSTARNIDIDPFIIAEKTFLYKLHYKSWQEDAAWIDGATMKNPLTGEPFDITGIHNIKMIYSLHYLADTRERFEEFLGKIKHVEHIWLAIVDGAELDDDHRFADGSRVIRVEDGWHPGMWWVESQLLWNSSRVRREPMLTMAFVQEFFEQAGFTEMAATRGLLGTKHMYFQRILKN